VSLHKWLFAPHGTGLLYVRRDKIKGLWPMQAADEKLDTDIRKFEEIGTHPAANFLAIGEALTFNQGIGFPRKEARLRFLRDYWAKRLLTNSSGRGQDEHEPQAGVLLRYRQRPDQGCGHGKARKLAVGQAQGADCLDQARRV
jgi:selenocysteine lyase/cysteine desulfurase